MRKSDAAKLPLGTETIYHVQQFTSKLNGPQKQFSKPYVRCQAGLSQDIVYFFMFNRLFAELV